jgi:hypothetical protein
MRGAPNLGALRGLGSLLQYGGHGHGHGSYGYGGGYWDYRHDADREYAHAMRDAAIADAVVGVTGIIAGAATAPYYAAPPAYPVYSPVYVPAPTRYVRERVLVRQGGYEDYEEWVPDRYDTHTGETIAGHYEVHRRYVPELWEERLVPVAP